jgi:RNA methyltransferase, TrmH family
MADMPAAYGDDPPEAADHPDPPTAAVQLARHAHRDPAYVRLEGVHALKHAVRFGADVEVVLSPDPPRLHALLAELAPDVGLPVPVTPVDMGTWRAVAGRELPSPVITIARRPPVGVAEVLAAPGRLVVLEDPRHLGNLGAAVRVAAAASAGGVLVVGDADPWHPTAVRGAAGLQFALPVARTAAWPIALTTGVGPSGGPRPVVALDTGGTSLRAGAIAPDAAILVGTERGGLSAGIRQHAELTVAIPMRPGVASLNLATAVAVALYAG